MGRHPKLWFAAILLLLLAQTAVSWLLPRSFALTFITDLIGFLLMFSALLAFAVNGVANAGRSRLFWMLQATGWGLMLTTQVLWMFFELVLRQETPNPFVGDVLIFLSGVPMLAGLMLEPHVESKERAPSLGIVDFLLLLLWWLYLYLFFVIPWQYVVFDEARYGPSYNLLAGVENLVILVLLAVLWYRSSGTWRGFYAVFFGAALCSGISDYLVNHAIDNHAYYTGSWYEVPYSASLAWFTVVAVLGFRLSPAPAAPNAPQPASRVAPLAMLAVLSLPVMAAWTFLDHTTAPQVSRFRILVALATMLMMALLVFLKQHRLGNELARMNQVLEEASLTDPLTGARNRRFFRATINADVGQVLRSYADSHDARIRDLVFYLIDADNFKQVNDRFGHDTGDKVLVEMARRISSAIRYSDVLVRWGGEEFLVVSRYTDRSEAETLAARVLAAVGNMPFVLQDGTPLYPTCSIGWAAFPWLPRNPQAVSYEEVLSLADCGLYQAKQLGKNRAIGVLPADDPKAVPLSKTANRKLFPDGMPVRTVGTLGPCQPAN